MIEFAQTVGNMTDAGQALYDAIKHKTLKLYQDGELRKEACFAIGKETPRGMRIVKEKASHKIDAIVALAMAMLGASSAPERITAGHISLGISEGSEGITEETREEAKEDLPKDLEWINRY